MAGRAQWNPTRLRYPEKIKTNKQQKTENQTQCRLMEGMGHWGGGDEQSLPCCAATP